VSLKVETKSLFGMVHLLPLPGSPNFGGDMERIFDRARKEADILAETGFDGLIVENFGDTPYPNGEVDKTQLAAMSAIVREISARVDIDIGVNVQFNDYESELAIAKTCGCDFVRIEIFTETVLTSSGIIEASAAEIMKTKKRLKPESSKVDLMVDVLSKGVTPVREEPVDLVAKRTEKNGADGIIVTGSGTGESTPLDYVREAKQATNLPVLVGSGLNANMIGEVLEVADGGIVGSALKEEGRVKNPVSQDRAREFIASAT